MEGAEERKEDKGRGDREGWSGKPSCISTPPSPFHPAPPLPTGCSIPEADREKRVGLWGHSKWGAGLKPLSLGTKMPQKDKDVTVTARQLEIPGGRDRHRERGSTDIVRIDCQILCSLLVHPHSSLP
jgi:hypothetical protein